MSLQGLFSSWAASPLLFVEQGLGVEFISTQQRDGLAKLELLVQAKERRADGLPLSAEQAAVVDKQGISIMSGHGTGKDAFTAWAILWFLLCFPYPQIPCTAPTRHQLRDVLWKEIHKWMRRSEEYHTEIQSGFLMSQWITWQAERIFFNLEDPGTEWFAVARTCNPKAGEEEQAETIAGFHEDYMMTVADEAAGCADPVFRPLEGSMTGRVNFALLIFNPTRVKGFAVESHSKFRANWICLHWNGELSELVSRESVDRAAKKYGTDSNFYRVRIQGLPPKADPDTLIPYDWVIDAVRRGLETDRELEAMPDDPTLVGIDVARFGDDKSIFLVQHGPNVTRIEELQDIDTERQADRFTAWMFDVNPDLTFVDVIGVGGGVADKLRAKTTFQIIDVNVAESPPTDGKFMKLRDELWWRTRERFERRDISIPDDEELIGELTTPKFEYLDGGKIKVQSKKDLKAKGKASPNKADALTYCQFYDRQFARRLRKSSQVHRRKREERTWRTI